MERTVMLVSPEPWDALPTNKHQIARRLAGQGADVHYVDWLGISALDWLRGRFRLSRDVGGLRCIEPPRLPIRVVRRSRILLSLDIAFKSIFVLTYVLALRKHLHVLITYAPTSYLPVRVLSKNVPVIYHCVDDIGSFPEWNRSTASKKFVYETEARLVGLADRTACSSRPIQNRLSQYSDRTIYWPNVGDYALFSKVALDVFEKPAPLANLEHPVIFFHGNLVPHKIDFDLVCNLADEMDTGTIVLLGPVENTLPVRINESANSGRLVLLPAVSQEQVLSFLANVDLLFLPYIRSAHTDSVFPLKVMEYMATGLPLISTPLASVVESCGDTIEYFSSPADVIDLIARVDDLDLLSGSRQSLARANSWETRMAELDELIATATEERRRCMY